MKEIDEDGPFALYDAVAQYREDHQEPASSGSSKLLPCPFCGTTDLFFYPDGDMEGYCIVGRHAPDCPLDTFGYAEKEDAVKAWNKRAR